jgi:hypothetical protein
LKDLYPNGSLYADIDSLFESPVIRNSFPFSYLIRCP